MSYYTKDELQEFSTEKVKKIFDELPKKPKGRPPSDKNALIKRILSSQKKRKEKEEEVEEMGDRNVRQRILDERHRRLAEGKERIREFRARAPPDVGLGRRSPPLDEPAPFDYAQVIAAGRPLFDALFIDGEQLARNLLVEAVEAENQDIRARVAALLEEAINANLAWLPNQVFEWIQENSPLSLELLRLWTHQDKGAAIALIENEEVDIECACRVMDIRLVIEEDDENDDSMIHNAAGSHEVVVIRLGEGSYMRADGEREYDFVQPHRDRLRERAFFGVGVTRIEIMRFWFKEIRKVSFPRILEQIEQLSSDPTLCVAPDDEYFEFRPHDTGEEWVSTQTLDDAPVEGEFRITGKATALFPRRFLTAIGGDDGIPLSVVEDCEPVPLFEIEVDGAKRWVHRGLFRGAFPRNKFEEMLEKLLQELEHILTTELVGQELAKTDLIDKVLAMALSPGQHRHPVTLSELNMAFVGSPGTGKTTFAELAGRLMFFSGLSSTGHVVTRTGAAVGQGTGNADQAALGVIRLYERAKGGVFFIDEVYGILGGNPQPTANQFAVINTIIERSLKSRCCTVVAGYEKHVQDTFFGRNPGLKRRFRTVRFADYTGVELFRICADLGLKTRLPLDEKSVRMLFHLFTRDNFNSPLLNASLSMSVVRAMWTQLSIRRGRTIGIFDGIIQPEDVIVAWQQCVSDSDVYENRHRLLEACHEDHLQLEQRVRPPENAQAWEDLDDTCKQFVQSCCVIDPDGRYGASGILSAYQTWAGRRRGKLNKTQFVAAMGRVFQRIRYTSGTYYMGIRPMEK